jgi:MscS family membrane protein
MTMKSSLRLSGRWFALVLGGLALAGVGLAQILPRATPAPSSSPSESADPYGRESPYGTFLGFLRAMRDGHEEIAVHYLQLPKVNTGGTPEEIAREVSHVLDQRYTGYTGTISQSRLGNIDDGLPPDQERVGTLLDGDGRVDVLLVRRAVDDQDLWLISSETIREARRIYRELASPAIERWLPSLLVRNHVAAMQLWQVIAAILLLPVLYGVSLLLTGAALWLVRRRRPTSGATTTVWAASARQPATFLLTLLLHRASLAYVGMPLIYRVYYNRVIVVLLVLGTGWLLWRLADLLVSRFMTRLVPSATESYAVFGLGQRILKVVIVVVTVLLAFGALGVNLTPTLAGLGIGGIAIAFAAQKSLENIFGGFSVLGGRVIRIGDVCSIGAFQGQIEDITLTATLLRTNDRTLVQIPNGTLFTEKIENLSRRDKFWFRPIIGLRYETTSQQLRRLLSDLRGMLAADQRVERETARVRFIRFGAYSLDVEIFAYVRAASQPEFLSVQEELLVKIIELIEASGTDIALPAQTSYISQDRALGAWERRPPPTSSPASKASSPAPAGTASEEESRQNRT